MEHIALQHSHPRLNSINISDDILFFPGVAAAISIVILGLHCFPWPHRKLLTRPLQTEPDGWLRVKQLGGPVIYSFQVIRLVSTLSLLILSVYTTVREARKRTESETWDRVILPQIILCATYTYASVLSLISLTADPQLSKRFTRHLASILIVTWAVFAYRDVWPLMTYTLDPLDAAEGGSLWVKLSVLTLGALVVPGFVPREYTPVNQEEPMSEPNPEQTASILSMMFHQYLDGIVILANKVSHLSLDQLLPLSDYDWVKNLMKGAQSELDPFISKRQTHIFWKLLSIYRYQLLNMTAMLIIRLFTTIAAPIGINRLLNYMETGGRDAIVQPWVWVLWLFLSPTLTAVAVQWYEFNATTMLVRTEAILTQIIFDHALRIRVKAETKPSSNDESATASNASNSEAQTEVVSSEGVASRAQQPVDRDKGDNLVGKMNNLVTSDLAAIVSARDFLIVVVYIPLHTSLCVWLLYSLLGWSSFVGLGVMIVATPLPGFLTKLIQKYHIGKMKKSDARVQSVSEALNVIRMVKLFGWEGRIADQVSKTREEELTFIGKSRTAELCLGVISYTIPLVTMISTFATYTAIMKRPLTASRVFSATAVFEMFRLQSYATLFFMIPIIVKAKVSLDRINEFMWKTELLDNFTHKPIIEGVVTTHAHIDESGSDRFEIGFQAAEFTWENRLSESSKLEPRKREFVLRIPDKLFFKQGAFNLILGPTGSGKTSLLLSLLGELHYRPLTPDSFYNLPRSSGVAYAAQESWILNETIRKNILFGSPYDAERYNKVIQQCALERDLILFDAGDETEVGEKGLTLSGGQKARVTLARAVYSSAQILLLDDVLAALDVHTSRWIIDRCFKGDLMAGRTTILVTHNVALASPVAEFVVSLSADGTISSQGQLSNVLAQDKTLSTEFAAEKEVLEEVAVDEPNPNKASDGTRGKLIVEEEISIGRLGWPALKMFLIGLGGKFPVLFWLQFCGSLLCCELALAFVIWFAGYWAEQYEHRPPSEVSVAYFLERYSVLGVLVLVFASSGYLVFVFGSVRASRTIHRQLLDSVFGATLRWIDTTPISRIIARCTQDTETLDGRLSWTFMAIIDMSTAMVVKFGGVVMMSPIFIIPGSVIVVLGIGCGQLYMRAQLPVKREMSIARAPVLAHFDSAIAGLTSIRAYGAQEAFRTESFKRIDRYSRAARMFHSLQLWANIRVETLGGLFSSSLAAYLLYHRGSKPSNTGFALDMAVTFSGMILWYIMSLNDFEIMGNSLERILQYTVIEQEPKPNEGGVPPAYWPASGDLRVEHLSARYSKDGPKVLQDITFNVKSGERVGIVGRTGSGKSSLTLSLLRCIYTEGKVYYDGIPIDSINLDALRSNITIIPQVPELMSGTLRQNLDPFSEHDDAVLNDALRAAGLFSLHEEGSNGHLTLDSQIASAGGNLSVGQRQILALARAIIRRSKLLILDEATSAIDYETDAVIQTSLRKELPNDVTLLIVAHRLQTIMDADKILVLDAGRIVEFGKPSELLQNEHGLLRALVDDSVDKEKLYAMSAGAV